MKKVFSVVVLSLLVLFGFNYAYADLNDGLVAHYSFEENVTDHSTSANHGEVYTNPNYVDGIVGKAIELDTSKTDFDYIYLGHNSSFDADFKNGDISIATWIKGDSFAVFSDYTCSGIYRLQYLNGIVKFTFNTSWTSSIVIQSDTAIDNTEFHHIGVTVEGNVFKLFVDGVVVKEETHSDARLAWCGTSTHFISAVMINGVGEKRYVSPPTPHWYQTDKMTYLDEYRVYNRALSEAEFLELYTLDSNLATTSGLDFDLVAHYSFDEVTTDSSPFQNDGAVYTNPNYVDGVKGKAIELDSYKVDFDYVDLAHANMFDANFATGDISIATWIKGNSFAVFSDYTCSGNYKLQYLNGIVQFSFNSAWTSSVVLQTDTAIDNQEFQHIAVTVKGNTFKLFVNGELQKEEVHTDSRLSWCGVGNCSSRVMINGIAAENGTTPPLPNWKPVDKLVYLDEYRVYRRALADAEVEELYHLDSIPVPSNVSTIAENEKAVVQWDSVEGAKKYYVYMGYDSGVSKSNYSARLPATNLNTNFFIWKPLMNYEDYYFVVSAVVEVDGVDVESRISAEVTATPVDELFDVQVDGVSFLSQLEANCSPNNYLCGFAVTNMQTAFLINGNPTVTDMQNMAEHVTNERCPSVTSGSYGGFDGYLIAAQEIGYAPDSYHAFLLIDDIKVLVKKGIPVHVGLDYSIIGSYRCSTTWNGGHSVLVVGYSETDEVWYVHDPLCLSELEGAYREIPSSVFVDALLRPFVGGNEIDTVVVE